MHSPDRVRRVCRELHAWLVSYYVVRCYLVGSSTYKQCTTKYRYQSRDFVLTVYLYAISQHLQLGLWHNIILFRLLLCRKYSSAIYQTLPSVTSYTNIVIYNVRKNVISSKQFSPFVIGATLCIYISARPLGRYFHYF